MSSEDEDMECDLPETSVKTDSTSQKYQPTPYKYTQTYQKFLKWHQSNEGGGGGTISEETLLLYFADIAARSKPSTLIAVFSMLKPTIRTNHNIDITTYSKLVKFIKEKNVGYKSVKAKMFTNDELYKFVAEAPDYKWLDVKVLCAFAINGAYKEVLNVMVDHVKRYDNMFVVKIPQRDTTPSCTFPITGPFVDLVQQYIDLRPERATTKRFFLNYHNEKCTTQQIGRPQFNGMARRIADYLKLSEPERYSRYSFRKRCDTSYNVNSEFLNRNKPNSGGAAKRKATERIELDCQPRSLKKSSFSYTRSPAVSTFSSETRVNANSTDTGHECTFTCGQVKCALEENEQSALHAFDVMKPPEYTIADVTPAVYPSKPACRWIVAYRHNGDTVDVFNADEAFENITKSMPYNVRIDQQYVRGTTSRKLGAYVIVYGVNCRCHKEVANEIFNFTVREVKCET